MAVLVKEVVIMSTGQTTLRCREDATGLLDAIIIKCVLRPFDRSIIFSPTYHSFSVEVISACPTLDLFCLLDYVDSLY